MQRMVALNGCSGAEVAGRLPAMCAFTTRLAAMLAERLATTKRLQKWQALDIEGGRLDFKFLQIVVRR